jgi:hypothetical protein
LRGPCEVFIKKSSEAGSCSRVQFRDASLPGYELGSRGIELYRVFGIGTYRIMVKEELDCERKTSCVNLSVGETVINPLLGYEYERVRTLMRL